MNTDLTLCLDSEGLVKKVKETDVYCTRQPITKNNYEKKGMKHYAGEHVKK